MASGAAWAVWKALGDGVEFHPGVYGVPPPNVTGRDVILVDFSYKRPVMEAMCQSAASITGLDHHKTAAEELDGLGNGPNIAIPVFVCIDMEKSGAVLAWEHFHPGKETPRLLQHVQDRDLWRFALPNTREIIACLFSHPFDFGQWDRLAAEIERDPTTILIEGAAIERKLHKDVGELLSASARVMTIGGYRVPVANLPFTLASDAGNLLCQRSMDGIAPPFAGIYYDLPSGRTFSLRSVGDFDVSEIAKKYGGGGHKNAAGFRVPLGWDGEAEV
ncbi:MAG TPA: phosphohydrolase [Magnetospirillum sp.]|nr:phosphohydrolase [Magnetospirillum sp.]